VGNSPVNHVDPSGLETQSMNGGGNLGFPSDQAYADWYAQHMVSINRTHPPLTGAPPGGGPTLLGDLALMVKHPIAALQGAYYGWQVDGMAMMYNAATFHQIDALDAFVDDRIAQNGTSYQVANVSAHVGVYALELAGILYVGAAYGVTSVGTMTMSQIGRQLGATLMTRLTRPILEFVPSGGMTGGALSLGTNGGDGDGCRRNRHVALRDVLCGALCCSRSRHGRT
jgi:hypothetical protein